LKSPKKVEREGDDENTERKSVRINDKKWNRSDLDAGRYTTVMENGSNASEECDIVVDMIRPQILTMEFEKEMSEENETSPQ